jgi:hypothetical protein
MKTLLIGAFLVVASAPGWAQEPETRVVDNHVLVSVPLVQGTKAPIETGLAEIIRAKFPLSVTYKDFGAGWRELIWQDSRRYFTRGETAIINQTEYLVAYVFDSIANEANDRANNEKEYVAQLSGRTRPYEANDRFALTLFVMKDIVPYLAVGNTNLRSFEAARMRFTFDPPLNQSAYRQQLTVLYLKKLYEAVDAYSSTYLDVTPPLESAFAARQALLPFARNSYVFNVPGSAEPFKVNPILGNKKRTHLRKRRYTAMFYESYPAADGLRAVLFYNGAVRRVDNKSWQRIKEASEIP